MTLRGASYSQLKEMEVLPAGLDAAITSPANSDPIVTASLGTPWDSLTTAQRNHLSGLNYTKESWNTGCSQ